LITWTEAGAVERPRMVQVRVQRSYPGRVRAGAPVPTRSMSPEEIADNLRFFTEGIAGPRTEACNRLVLSGVGVAARADTPDQLALALELGLSTVVLHAGVEDLDTLDVSRLPGVGTVVVPVQPGPGGALLQAGARAIRACRDAGVRVAASTQLTGHALGELDTVARAVARARPDTLTFTYPFPIGGNTSSEVARPPAVLRALTRVVPRVEAAGVTVHIKGLPACYLGGLADRHGRSANRWYVDADHQHDRALLFFPGVVAFTKEDACRFCALDGRCDGFFATYLRRSGFPALTAVSDPRGA